MSYFRKIMRFARPYMKFAGMNIFFNLLYAVFNVLSVLTFIPVLGILFGREEKVTEKPVFQGITGIYDYVQDSLNFYVSDMMETGGVEKALVYYWFDQSGRRLTSDIATKFYLTWDAFWRGRRDGALIRYMTPLRADETEAKAEARLRAAIESSILEMPRFIATSFNEDGA